VVLFTVLKAYLKKSFSFMMAVDRVLSRNVFIYNGATGASLGGMRQNGSVTEAVFLWILSHILLIIDEDADFHVRARASQEIIEPTSNVLELGDYDVYSDGMCYNLKVLS
jgi:hypothetical protein